MIHVDHKNAMTTSRLRPTAPLDDERSKLRIARDIGVRLYNTARYMRPGDGRYRGIVRRLKSARVPWMGGLLDMVCTAYLLGMEHTDDCDYRPFELTRDERRLWAGRRIWAEVITLFNEPNHSEIFRDKCRFLEVFSRHIRREWLPISDETEPAQFSNWCQRHPSFIAKPLDRLHGAVVMRYHVGEADPGQALQDLRDRVMGLVEEETRQHFAFQALNPSSVNTVRIVTLLWEERVHLLSAVLRMGRDGIVDNLAAGGYAAPLDIMTGVVNGPAVDKKGGRKRSYDRHPLSQTMIMGFKISDWDDVKRMIEEAAQAVPQVRTVGWDVAIAGDGPMLVEGNHNWCRKPFQLPCGRGAAQELLAYMPQGSAYSRRRPLEQGKGL